MSESSSQAITGVHCVAIFRSSAMAENPANVFGRVSHPPLPTLSTVDGSSLVQASGYLKHCLI